MSEVLIRAQIKSILSGVTGVSNVHDYQRWADRWDAFLSYFKDSNDTINGWTITREKTPALCASVTHDERRHAFRIRGYYGLRDADETEITFQALIEAVCAAFRAKRTLNSTAEDTDPVQVEIVELRVFGTVLCHYCELLLVAEEFEDWS